MVAATLTAAKGATEFEGVRPIVWPLSALQAIAAVDRKALEQLVAGGKMRHILNTAHWSVAVLVTLEFHQGDQEGSRRRSCAEKRPQQDCWINCVSAHRATGRWGSTHLQTEYFGERRKLPAEVKA